MAAARPFGSFRELGEEADRVWRSLSRKDWLEAFAAHPPIGGAPSSRPSSAVGTGPWGLSLSSVAGAGPRDLSLSSVAGAGPRDLSLSSVAGAGPRDLSPQHSLVWSREEQDGTRGASPETLANLADANRDYEERFGHIFVVCASGRNAAEMLALAQARLANDPDTELAIAAEEQRKITRLRLEKLLAATDK